MELTIELKEKTIQAVADRVKLVNGKIMLFNVRSEQACFGSPLFVEVEELVGSFGDYKNFYIKGNKA